MVGGALPSYPHQHLHFRQFRDGAILEMRGEGFEYFKTLRVFANDNLGFWLRIWHWPWVIRDITECETRRWEVLSGRWFELEQLPGRQRQRISHRVE